MAIAAAPKLVLCENLTIDFALCAQAHDTIGVIWRIAAIVCVVAASVLASFLLFVQLSEAVFSLEAILIYGALSAFTLLAFRSFWIAGTDEFAQSAFYGRVAAKEIELQAIMDEPEIKRFFTDHSIEIPKQPAVKPLLQERVEDDDSYLRAFIPSIAHFETLCAEPEPQDTPIGIMQYGLDQLNLAMILQSMHRPTENTSMKLDNRFTDLIPSIGRFDRMNVVKELHEEENCPAFLFEGARHNQSLSIGELVAWTPEEIRAEIFDLPIPVPPAVNLRAPNLPAPNILAPYVPAPNVPAPSLPDPNLNEPD